MRRESKSRITDRTKEGKVADYALASAIVLAPVLGGGSNLVVLPIIVGAVLVATVASVLASRRVNSSLHLTPLVVILVLLTIVTLLQVVPFPNAWIAVLSPKSLDLRTIGVNAAVPDFAPITYEPSATLREAAKLGLYALVALVAHERMRARKNIEIVTIPVVIAGLMAAGLAVIHRVLGMHRFLGVMTMRRPTSDLLTTFANANHSAGFMALTSLVALGFATSRRVQRRSLRVGGYAVAGLCAFVSILAVSRGGLAALTGGIVLFGISSVIRQKKNKEDAGALKAAIPAGIALCVVMPVLLIFTRLETWLWAFSRTGEPDLGPKGKVAAFQDVWPMIRDHRFFGIGRGSYTSLYMHYKTSATQLTYAYPENIAVQFVVDWGLVLGPILLLCAIFTIAIRFRRADTEALGALAGVSAVLAQNIVDFSLELPGVAVPVAAILGATGVGVGRRLRLPLKASKPALTLLFAVSVAVLVGTIGAFVTGDYERDLEALERMTTEETLPPLADFAALAERHPANAYVASMVAFAAETSSPPDVPAAAKWANRALYLAPTYADAHFAIGRLLLRSDHRSQAFIELREAWRLMSEDRKPSYIRSIVRLSQSSEELLAAVPREENDPEQLTVGNLLAGARIARNLGKRDWAQDLVRAIDADSANTDQLRMIALEALAAREGEIADRCLEKLRVQLPNDPEVGVLYARRLFMTGNIEGARAEAMRIISLHPRNPVAGLKLLIELALVDSHGDEAQRLYSRLVEAMPHTRQGQVELARVGAVLEVRAGNPSHALKALSHAIDLAPEALSLRAVRARVLRDTGHFASAVADLKYVLARQPENNAIKKMIALLEARRHEQEGALKRRNDGDGAKSEDLDESASDGLAHTQEASESAKRLEKLDSELDAFEARDF